MESCVMQQRFEDLTQYLFAAMLENDPTEPTRALDCARLTAGKLIHHFTDEAMVARGLELEDRDDGTVLH